MNAVEIIEEIKRLPEDERGKVIAFIKEIPNETTLEAMRAPVDEERSFKNSAELFKALDSES